MNVYRPRHAATDSLSLLLLSDLHVEASTTDVASIRADLARADELDARILIAGDIFDGIFPGDKRWTPTTLAPSLRHTDDIFGAVVDYAVSVLWPFADRIDLLAPGNHDDKIKRQRHVDLIAALAQRLNVEASLGNYAGVVQYGVGRRTVNVGYWHGAGGGASREAAVRQCGKLLANVEGLDVAWTGHRHQRFAFPTRRVTLRRGKSAERRVWLAMSGSYGRWEGYALDAMHAPGDRGGVVMTFRGNGESEVTL